VASVKWGHASRILVSHRVRQFIRASICGRESQKVATLNEHLSLDAVLLSGIYQHSCFRILFLFSVLLFGLMVCCRAYLRHDIATNLVFSIWALLVILINCSLFGTGETKNCAFFSLQLLPRNKITMVLRYGFIMLFLSADFDLPTKATRFNSFCLCR